MGEVEEFFCGLAERFWKENDLSDVTYAVCQASDEFRKFFLEYCFDEEGIDTYDLTREFSRGDSRPDFYFHDKNENKNERIIEVKIFDRNQHFEQYKKDFPKAKYSFIANYPHEDVPGWKIRTWKGFCKELKKSPLTESDFLVGGYLEFLRRIIKMPEFEKVNIGKTTDLPKFYDNLENIFAGDYGFSEYTGKFCTQGYYGRVFGKKDLWIWIGIYLYDGKIWIAFKDDEDWTPKGILKKLKELCKKEEDELSGFVYWFPIEDDEILRDENTDAAAQKKALKEFIEDVFDKIGAPDYLKQE